MSTLVWLLTWFAVPEQVYVGVEQDLEEGQDQVEQHPDVDHLHVGGGRQLT